MTYNIWYVNPVTGKDENKRIKAKTPRIAAWQLRRTLGKTLRIKAIIKT